MSGHRHTKAGHPSKSWPAEWPVGGSTPNLILIGLILSSDASGAYATTQSELAKFGVCCVETARSAIEKLTQANCLSVDHAGRGQGGSFGAKLYRLNLHQERVATMFGLLRGPLDDGEIAAAYPVSPYPHLPPAKAKRRRETSPTHPEIRDGGYKDTRAHAGASSNFIFSHSLPADFQIEEALKPQVQKVLSVCGVGLADVQTPGLLESLVECLPEAQDDGYDFELDILPCVKRKTSGHRVERLWSFRIIFKNDLPEWKRNRIAKEQRRAIDASPHRRSGYERGLHSKSDSLDALLRKPPFGGDVSTRISTLQLTLMQLEDPNAPDWVLPRVCRNLVGEERAAAIARERTDVIAKLNMLNADQSPQL